MGIKFASASSQSVTTTTIYAQTVPFTVGLWMLPTTNVADGGAWSMGGSASDIGWLLGHNSATAGSAGARYWGGAAYAGEVTIASAFTALEWRYLLFRNISSTQRRLHLFNPVTGLCSHANNTTSVSPGTLGRMTLGGYSSSVATSSFLNGTVAEFFYATGDIQPDGAAIDDGLLRTLAMYGPWSIPHIVPMIDEYRSLVNVAASRSDMPADVFQKGGIRTWTLSGAPVVGRHPPLAATYVRPASQVRRLLTA